MESYSDKELLQNIFKNLHELQHNIIKNEENNQLQISQIQKNIDTLNKNYNELNNKITSIEKNLNHNSLNDIIEKDNSIKNKEKNKPEIKNNSNLQNENKNKEILNNIGNQRGKYKNKKDRNIFESNIHNITVKDGEKKWFYSLSSYNKINNTGYYYCSDTNCEGRDLIRYDASDVCEFEKINEDVEKFTATKKHSLIYTDHSYNKQKEIINEINTSSKNNIKKN